MKTLGLSLALVALIAAPALAGWTTSEGTATFNAYFAYEGNLIYGTVTIDYSTQFMDNGQNSFVKGTSSWDFEAEDGSLSATGNSSFNVKGSSNSANTYSSRGQVKVWTEAGLDVTNSNFHYTFNANGELTSFHFN